MTASAAEAAGAPAGARPRRDGAAGWPLAARLARRELRGGLRGFRIFLACLALGVAAIAAVGSTRAMLEASITDDARAILGGDVLVDIVHRPATPGERAGLEARGAVSASIEMRTMARTWPARGPHVARPAPAEGPDADADAARTLVELKAVDAAYPLYGTLETEPQLDHEALFARRDGRWGLAAAPDLLTRLGVGVGDAVAIGEAVFEVRAAIAHEPDRLGGGGFLQLGPRAMIAEAAIPDTGLVQPGSLIHYNYRVRLPAGTAPGEFIGAIDDEFPDAGWRIRALDEASPQLSRLIRRVTLFLGFVGMTALLVGGVGVANAVRTWLDGKTGTIATLKCLGAPRALVFRVYLLQVLALALLGTVIGLVAGAALPPLAADLLGRAVPLRIETGLFPEPLAVAALFGLLTALAFSIWPLARAGDVPAGSLFRALVAPAGGWPRAPYVAATAGLAAALAGLAIASASDWEFAAWFVVGSIGAMIAFRLAAAGIARLAARAKGIRRPALRLALAGLHRPGAPTASVVLSLGLGLSMLVTVATIEGNLARELADELPEDAPAFFFVDIQPGQVAPFEAIVADMPGIEAAEQVPMLRGRIVKIDGVPAGEATITDERWALRGDRGITWAAEAPEHNRIVAGEWWPPDYTGEPLLSLDEDIARGFGIGIGDTLTVNILGREFTAKIANLREVDFRTLAINFLMIFSPGFLESAPRMHIAIVRADPPAEDAIERRVTDAFPNVTSVRVRETLERVAALVENVGLAVRLTAIVTLVAGTLVLAGAIAAGHRRRIYDAVVLKVLGATRRDVVAAFLLEYGLLGLTTAAIAAAVGGVTGWAVVTFLLDIDWRLLPGTIAATAAIATAITLAAGLVGTWRAMGQKAAPWLRNE